MRRNLALAIVAVVGWVVAAQAAPLDLKEVSADAKWAAHFDMDALMASPIPEKARQKILEKCPEAERHFSMICAIWNFAPGADLHGITIYGSELKRKSGVAIVHAKVDQARLVALANQAPEHQTASYGKYELHQWIHSQGTKHERPMVGTFYKPDVLVFGPTIDEVKAALDVLDGAKPNFSGSESGLTMTIPSGAILVAGATGIMDADLPCKSPLCKKANAVVLAVGTEQDNLYVVGQLVAKETEVAQQIKAVLDGAMAMAVLTQSDDQLAMKLINAIKVNRNDKTVNLEWRAPIDDTMIGIHQLVEHAKKKHKSWMHD